MSMVWTPWTCCEELMRAPLQEEQPSSQQEESQTSSTDGWDPEGLLAASS